MSARRPHFMHSPRHLWRLWASSLLLCSVACGATAPVAQPPAPLAAPPEPPPPTPAPEPTPPTSISHGLRAGEQFGCFTIAADFRLVGEFPGEPGPALDDLWERTRAALTHTADIVCPPQPGVTCDDSAPAPGCVPAWAVPESVFSVTWDGPVAEMLFQVATPGGPVSAALSSGARGPALGWEVRNYIGDVAVTRIAKWLEHAGGQVTGLALTGRPGRIRVRRAEPGGDGAAAPDPALEWDTLMVYTLDAADGASLVSVSAQDWEDDSAGESSACLREAGVWRCTPRSALRAARLGAAVPTRFLGRNDMGTWITEWRWDERGSFADETYVSEVVLVSLGQHRGLTAHRIARVGVGARWRGPGVRGDQVEHHERAYLTSSLQGEVCIRLEWGARERTVHLLRPGWPLAPGYPRESISALDAAASIGAAPGVFLIPQSEGAGWVACPEAYR